MHSWLRQSGINTLTPVIEEKQIGKQTISIRQDKSQYGDTDVLREQMVDVAVLKLSKVAGVTSDEWDSDGELELCKKFEVQQVQKRVLIAAAPLTEDVIVLDSKPDAVLVNFKNYGYCRMRFDEDSRKQLIANLRYVKDTSTRTYIKCRSPSFSIFSLRSGKDGSKIHYDSVNQFSYSF